MGDGHNFRQLKEAILAHSQAQDWEIARKEWSLVRVATADEPETCPCGHFPILEICTIANQITGHRIDVGNRCVKRFLGVRSDLIFAAIKRIQSNIEKSLNGDAIVFFHQCGVLNNWEYSFLQDTMRLRQLTLAQKVKRQSINEKVIAAVAKRGFHG